MSTFKILFQDTIQKELRSKSLLWLFILNILFIVVLSGGINYIAKMLQEFGAPVDMKNQSIHIISFFVSFWTGVLSILFGVSCIRTDEEEGVLGQILSLPTTRFNYLMARAFGSTVLSLMFFLLLNVIAFLMIMISGDDFPFLATAPIGFITTFCSIFGIVLLSIFVSFFMGRMLSFITMVFLYFFLSGAESIFFGEEIASYLSEMSFFKGVSLLFYTSLPHVSTLSNLTSKLLIGANYNGFNYLLEAFHYLFSVGFLVFIISFFFKRKEV